MNDFEDDLLFQTVKGYIDDELEKQIKARTDAYIAEGLARIEKFIASQPKPENGKDADPLLIRRMVREAVDEIPRPKDGTSVAREEVEAMVRREVDALPKPRDGDPGKSVTVDEVAPLLEDMTRRHVADAVKQLPPPAKGDRGDDGKSVDPVALAAMIVEGATKAVAALPRPQDGKSVTPADVEPMLRELVAKAVEAIPKPADGKSVRPEDLAPMVREEVAAAVKALPPAPKGDDGKSVTIEEIVPLIAKAVAVLPRPKDGVSPDPKAIAAEVLETVTRGLRVPEDGRSVTLDDVRPLLEAAIARQALEFERRAADVMHTAIERAVEKLPAPKPGEAGRDGISIEHLDLQLDDDFRTLRLTARSGDVVVEKTAKIPALIYRGVCERGRKYERGDTFTYGGSLWITMKDATGEETPGDGSGVYRLAVKKGADAKVQS